MEIEFNGKRESVLNIRSEYCKADAEYREATGHFARLDMKSYYKKDRTNEEKQEHNDAWKRLGKAQTEYTRVRAMFDFMVDSLLGIRETQ